MILPWQMKRIDSALASILVSRLLVRPLAFNRRSLTYVDRASGETAMRFRSPVKTRLGMRRLIDERAELLIAFTI